MPSRHSRFWIILLLLAGLAWRAVFLLTGHACLDGDEAFGGLVAHKILHGRLFIFYEAQHYMSAIDAYLCALCAWLSSTLTPLTVKCTALLTFLFYALTLHLLARQLFADRAVTLWTLTLVMLAPAYFTLWSLKMRGGFILVCALGNLMLCWAYRLMLEENPLKLSRSLTRFMAFCGFCWHVYALIAPYLLTACVILFLLRADARRRVARELFGARRLINLCIDAPATLLFLVVFIRTFNIIIPYQLYRPALMLWIILAAVILILECRGDRRTPLNEDRTPPFQFPYLRRLIAFSAGMSLSLFHLWFVKEDLWYSGGLRLSGSIWINLVYILIHHLPVLLGPFNPVEAPVLTPAGLVAWLAAIGVFGLLGLNLFRNDTDFWHPRRKTGLLILLIQLGCCILFFTLSNAAMISPRHLVTAYTALFLLAGLAIVDFSRFHAALGALLAAAIIASNAWFAFFKEKPVPVRWPQYSPLAVENYCAAIANSGVDSVYIHDYDLAMNVLFRNQNRLNVVMRPEIHRYADLYDNLLRSRNFGLLMFTRSDPRPLRGLAAAGIQARSESVEQHLYLYRFEKNGEPCDFLTVKQAASSAQ